MSAMLRDVCVTGVPLPVRSSSTTGIVAYAYEGYSGVPPGPSCIRCTVLEFSEYLGVLKVGRSP